MFQFCKNSKIQGDVGLSCAIQYFSVCGYTVSIPLTDSQDYDLVVEIQSILYKVQVKTVTHKAPSGYYRVSLRTCGGNSKGTYIKYGTDIIYDLLFVLTDEGDCYLIPKKEIINHKAGVTLGKDKDCYKVFTVTQNFNKIELMNNDKFSSMSGHQ